MPADRPRRPRLSRPALSRFTGAVAVVVMLACIETTAQSPSPQQAPYPSARLTIAVEPSGQAAVLTYFNRPIVTLRAQVMGRSPAERGALAVRALDDLVAAGRTGPVGTQTTEGGVLISVGQRIIVGLTPTDIDPLAGETLQGVTDAAVRRVQQALNEAAEARRPYVWLIAGARAVGALLVGLIVLSQLGRARAIAESRLSALVQKGVARVGLADQPAVRTTRLLVFIQHRILMVAASVLQLTVLYMLATFTLRQFPYTRPWGESLRSSLLAGIGRFAQAIVNAVPGLLAVVAIIALTRTLTKVMEPWFEAVECGVIKARWVAAETAATTRRLVTTILWLLAAAIAYPYVPGSGTDAFKGISIFVGLMVTLGSSGLINQIISGFMVTYSRALRRNDFVKIGDVEGTITQLGLLATKVRTLRSEEVTIPNALVVSQMITDYSRFTDSVRTTTSVTIGYGAAWRQVHALLLLAAERTPGVRQEPKPRVQQTALEDLAVRYTLSFCLEQQQSRVAVKTVLHGHIQDLFNEYGVQIMTPRYEADPEVPKLVRKKDWFAAPAKPEASSDVTFRSSRS